MKTIHYNVDSPKIKYLVGTDNNLAALINYIGNCTLKLEENGFKCIIQYIIGQQISDKTRETLWKRFNSKYKNITPQKIINEEVSELKKIGISGIKANYIKNVAEAILNNDINFEEFKTLSNEDIIKKLTKIKGIGKWTAEMYLIFSLGRENVLSYGDGTIKRCIKWMYNIDHLPDIEELKVYFSNWLNYSTIVSLYFWKTVELGILDKKLFKDIKNY